MKRITLGMALLAGISATAQDKLEVTAKIDGLKEGDIVYFWRPLGAGRTDSTYVKNGGFATTIDMKDGGSTYIIKIGREPLEIQGTFMYLEAGKLDIKGKGPYFQDVVKTGSAFVNDWNTVEKDVLPQLADGEKEKSLEEDLQAALQVGDQDAADKIYADLNTLKSQKSAAAKNWILANPNSGVSSFLINAYMSHLGNDDMLALIEKLGPGAKNTFTIRHMLQNITGVGTISDNVGKPVPNIELKDNNGKLVKLTDFKGKYVLIDFWASWCKPCRAQSPALAEAYNKFKDKGFTILSVSIDEDHNKWKTAITEDKLTWPQVIGESGPTSKVAADYSVKALPATMLIDRQGNLVKIGVSGKQLEDMLTKLL